MFSARDIQIMKLILKQGKSLVVAVNKMDVASDDTEEYFDWMLSFFKQMGSRIPIVELSAKQGWGVSEVLETAIMVSKKRRRIIPPKELITAFKEMLGKSKEKVVHATMSPPNPNEGPGTKRREKNK
mmetsp:Transcript_28024/g.54627  ORF Transcript_28024/g.54627 Transcript_28024/m.54627 type:complete len:127 (-) Transcript_28024:4-384(-)